MSFVRLPLDIKVPFVDEKDIKLVFTAGEAERGKYRYANDYDPNMPIATTYMYSLPTKIETQITCQLPKQFIENERPQVHLMKIIKGQGTQIPPHIDRGRRVAINIYTQCDGERTIFYDEKAGKLVECGFFNAKSGEVWLLDVSKPHSVLFGNGKKRSLISIGYNKIKFSDLKI